jgi:exodeoxyribonuclease III
MISITTWNVNGFRAVLKKNFRESIAALNPDILCLQEIKAKIEQVTPEEAALDGYLHQWNSAERPGYSGVAVYYKDTLVKSIAKGIGSNEFDIEGRVIQLDLKDFVLFNIYFPNGQRGQDRVDFKLDFYRFLLEKCDELHKQGRKIVITGDFNTAHNEIDLANPKENSKVSGFLPEERVWIDKFLENGFRDAYRELYPDKVEYTWWTYRVNARARGIGWRLDYFLVSEDLLPRIKEVKVHNDVMGSDHCPVTMVFE